MMANIYSYIECVIKIGFLSANENVWRQTWGSLLVTKTLRNVQYAINQKDRYIKKECWKTFITIPVFCK